VSGDTAERVILICMLIIGFLLVIEDTRRK
jgi:hypothetical protein